MNTLLSKFVGDAKIPSRTQKPPEGMRQNGITHVVDNGLPVSLFEEQMATCGAYIDSVEFDSGTAFVVDMDVLKQKISCCHKYNVQPMFSTLVFEKFAIHGQVDTYQKICEELGIVYFNIGDTIFSVPRYEKQMHIERFAKIGTVYSSIGSNDSVHIMPPYRWIEYIVSDSSAGAKRVIAIGGRSGNIGLYRGSGEVREGLVQEIIASNILDANIVLWTAPQRLQQTYYVEMFNADANLAGVRIDQVLYLESMRMGVDEYTTHLYL